MMGGLYHGGLSCVVHMGGHSDISFYCRLGILTTLFSNFLGTLSYFFCVLNMFVDKENLLAALLAKPKLGRSDTNGL